MLGILKPKMESSRVAQLTYSLIKNYCPRLEVIAPLVLLGFRVEAAAAVLPLRSRKQKIPWGKTNKNF